MYACQKTAPAGSRKRQTNEEQRKGGGIEPGGREHPLKSACPRYRWQSSSTIAIDQAYFVATNHFHRKTAYDRLPTTTMAHDDNDMVTPCHRLVNEHPPRRQPIVAPTQLNATSG
ncbi:hypothetical protein K443DRAFT_4159 [Laccaria amethystina LaAM-08-1]|uniref:Uncharacterized protein n=1 Tax=Laccaria amethystina LaAM-08-1 TaxID=1095629 RepID=A0A0C9WYU2_9AGAR|nr:hypothetical protein K443DRAFT_4159 [Laccaria amethystina LaAM-08-1]